MFRFTIVRKNSINNIDYSQKPETVKMIEYIESQLTQDQLKKLEISGRGETFSFKDRMIASYGHMYPTFLKIFKERTRQIVDEYSPLFEMGVNFDTNEPLIQRFKVLFFSEKLSLERSSLITKN